jgi:hypothetical protein
MKNRMVKDSLSADLSVMDQFLIKLAPNRTVDINRVSGRFAI